ncbi:MAG: tetratricopeptide repeat protein [Cyanobacteria bacterium SIG32]|nr:tetratricopeptide repeat protein [Cyanobacteria bacterium SIG32]
MKNLLKVSLAVALLTNCAYAGFKEHFDLGQQYLSNYQYSGAITEFKNALRINYLDNSARIGLINSYISRATYYGNTEHNYQKAADDYRSALFYMQYYPLKVSSQQYIPQVTANLNTRLSQINYDRTPQNRFKTAKQLRAEGNFSAAAYEFNQALADRSLQQESFEQVGDIMKLLGNNQKAAEYYRKSIAVDPDNIPLRLSYAKILDDLGNENAAVQEYNYILSKTNDNKELLYSLERIYKKKLEKSPHDADLTANLGAIMQKQGNFDAALMYYQKSESLNPSNINTRLNVGTLYHEKGDNKTAIKAYDSVLILYPDNVNANLYKAQANEAMGDTKSAIEGYKKVLALDPANVEAQNKLLNTVKSTMSTAQFIEYVKKNMAESEPANLFYNYALELHRQNKLTDAITLYKEALKSNTQNSEIYVNLAIAQNQAGYTLSSIETLKTALEKFPSNAQLKDVLKSVNNDLINSKLARAAEFFKKKDFKNAIATYQEISPATMESLLGIASTYQTMKDSKNAIAYYEKAQQISPKDSNIPYYIATIYADDEDWENARKYLNTSLSMDSNNKQSAEFLKTVTEQINLTNLNKAIALYDNEKYNDALTIFDQLIENDKNNSFAYYYRGMIYDTQNKRQDAINDFKKAYELNKEFEITNYLIAADYDTLENYKEAYTYYTKYASSNAQDDEYKQYAKARAEELKQYAN